MSAPRVAVTRTEGRGFLVSCTCCPRFRTLRASRINADWVAAGHLRGEHAQPSPEDEAAVVRGDV